MASTNGAMTSLPASQAVFLPSVEEPEHNSINFRDSLKFFQEQLVINGASFPSPSPVCQSGNDSLRKSGSFSYKENLSEISRVAKDRDIYEERTQSLKTCKIAIPTVDTILESVRVLRAIQKSQEARGSTWNLDNNAKPDTDSDLSYTKDWIQTSHVKQNDHLIDKSPGERTVETHEDESITDEVTDTDDCLPENALISKSADEGCPFWPKNTLVNNFLNEQNPEYESFFPSETKNNENSENYATDNRNTKEISTTDSDEKNEPRSDLNDNEIEDKSEQNDIYENNELQNFIESENKEISENNITCDTPDSLNAICTDVPNYINSYREDKNLLQVSNVTELLKIETDDKTDTQKQNFLLSESLWKGNFSPNENISIRTEHNDSDSGIGTQGSGFSLSPNIPNQMKKDSWSDSCSSLYASAECSPYHSLNSVFESSLGLCTIIDETKAVENSSNASDLTSSKWEKLQDYTEEPAKNSEVVSDLTSNTWKSVLETAQDNTKESVEKAVEQSNLESGVTSSECEDTQNESQNYEKELSEKTLENSEIDSGFTISKFEDTLVVKDPGSKEIIEVLAKGSVENSEFLSDLTNSKCENTHQKAQIYAKEPAEEQDNNTASKQNDSQKENDLISEKELTESFSDLEPHSHNEHLDNEISYCDFTINYTIQNPCTKTEDKLETAILATENDKEKLNNHEISFPEHAIETNKAGSLLSIISNEADDPCDLGRIQKFTAASCDLITIVESLYTIQENPAFQILRFTNSSEDKFEETLKVLSEGAFCDHSEDDYLVVIEDSTLYIKKDSEIICSLNMKYGEVAIMSDSILKVDNKMGRCVYIQCDFANLMDLRNRIELHCIKHWQTDCLQLVHYPLKTHQDVIIIDLGSCSTRAGILMDQPTLPSLFFPTICATDKRTGTSLYGMEALQSEVRQHSNLSFPVRPSIKITKHTIDIHLMEGLFKKIFYDLKVDPTQYTVQVSLPRNLSINAQTALIKLLLEDLNVKAVSLTNQALLTLYAHDVSTAVVVDIGDRTDVLPVVDGFIVENGVTKLPHGGQRLIHHMKHSLAEKRISLSNDIDSFVVQYIIENLAYIAGDYEKEMAIASQYPDMVKKTVTLQPTSPESLPCKTITLEEARFKIPEGLFNPDLWGLDSPGIHHLVQKAIQATSVDARKRIGENIYVSGGVTMLPGFVERLSKEVTKLNKAKFTPKVYASNYRYHCTYIGACKFAKMEVFPQVCVNLKEYSKNPVSALKKCALCF